MTQLTGSDDVGPASDEAHGKRTLALASLAVLATFLDTTVLFVAFPDIVRSFSSASTAQLSWVLNAYTITFASLLVPAGKLGDRLGHKRLFLLGSTAFTAASLACAVAPTAELLIAFRIVQAAGSALLIPASLALVLRAFPAERIPHAVAIWGATGAAAGALGPTLGAALVEAANWRWVFLLNLPVGLLTVVLGRRVLRESSDPDTPLPAPTGVVLIAAASALLALGIVQSDAWGWLDGRTLGALFGGVVLLGVFLRDQRRSPAPALDLDLFGSKDYRWANGAMLVFGTAFAAMFFGSILFLTDVWGWSILEAGLGISPGPAVVALLAPRFGKLAGRVGQRPLLVLGGLAYAAGGLWRVIALGATPDYVVDYLPSMLLTGLGVALCFPQLGSAAAQSLPANRLGVGGAVNQAVRQFGGTLGVALTIALLGQPTGIADALLRFDRIWWLIVLGGLGTSLLCLPIGADRRRPVAGDVPPLDLVAEVTP
jgi:EmrB/QacA subfamily drug resistance transporter